MNWHNDGRKAEGRGRATFDPARDRERVRVSLLIMEFIAKQQNQQSEDTVLFFMLRKPNLVYNE